MSTPTSAPRPDSSLAATWSLCWDDVIVNHFANFSGAVDRRTFWTFYFAQLVACFALTLVIAPAGVLLALVLFIPKTALAARRLREAGYSPWLLLLQLIPLLGWLVCIVMLAQPAKVEGG